MAVTFDSMGGGSGTSIDTTGETVTLPNDTKVVEVYLSAAGHYRKGAHDDATLIWLPIASQTWTTIRGLNGTLGLKADSGTVDAHLDTLDPIDIKQGR